MITAAHFEARNYIRTIVTRSDNIILDREHYPLREQGVNSLVWALRGLDPPIYDMNHPEKVGLEGLMYIMERLPKNIENCSHVRIETRSDMRGVQREIIKAKARNRAAYYVPEDQRMNIEVTKGMSEVYDLFTHLTFLYHEAQKVARRAYDGARPRREWINLGAIVEKSRQSDLQGSDLESALETVASVIGHGITDVREAYHSCLENSKSEKTGNLFEITYGMGELAHGAQDEDIYMRVSRNVDANIGRDSASKWGQTIREALAKSGFLKRPIVIVSGNNHSFMNAFYGSSAITDLNLKHEYAEALEKRREFLKDSKGFVFNHKDYNPSSVIDVAHLLSVQRNSDIKANPDMLEYACDNGMKWIYDKSGTDCHAQIIDPCSIPSNKWNTSLGHQRENAPVFVVHEYGFGDQAFWMMDQLLEPHGKRDKMQVAGIYVMGKAGIMSTGIKRDLILPSNYVEEGTANSDDVPNSLGEDDFNKLMKHPDLQGVNLHSGATATAVGTSLQNPDLLRYFASSHNAVGVEMELAHIHKAIKLARSRGRIDGIIEGYVYYASDEPMKGDKTLSSGSMGIEGIAPTYAATAAIIRQALKLPGI